MPLTHSLFTGLSGMNGSSRMLDVTGNNIANVNTTAFKRSRLQFETQIQDTLKNATSPNASRGGSNPAQIGLGVRIGAITRDFNSGALQPTGVATDMAIQNNGFFVVDIDGQQLYTRAGNFTLDEQFNLVNSSGARVQGFPVDNDFQVVEGQLNNINIPIGILTIAQATDNVRFSGNFNAGGDIASQGSLTFSESLFSDAAGTTPITGATPLNSLFTAAGGTPIFADSDIVTITEARKGGVLIGDKSFEVTTALDPTADDNGTTVQDFLDFLEDIMGIDTTQPGGALSITPAGEIRIDANYGTGNAIDLQLSNLVVGDGTATPVSPLSFTTDNINNPPIGESIQTTFVVYDSLGTPLTVNLNVIYENSDNGGTTWRFFAESEDDTSLDRRVGSGLLQFDNDGRFIAANNATISIDRDLTGAGTPLQVELDFSSTNSFFNEGISSLSSISQDGIAIGTLQDFNLSTDGTIEGIFSNGLLRTLGRVPLAMFSNNEGLEELGGSLFRASNNSGTANIVTAGTAGSGQIMGRQLETSNVELTEEFVNIIAASTGFSANSRVITTSNQLLDELLSIIR
ncbi:MAG: flagellar hook-basal body complex protein [Phycisphaeraceae bacterium]